MKLAAFVPGSWRFRGSAVLSPAGHCTIEPCLRRQNAGGRLQEILPVCPLSPGGPWTPVMPVIPGKPMSPSVPFSPKNPFGPVTTDLLLKTNHRHCIKLGLNSCRVLWNAS